MQPLTVNSASATCSLKFAVSLAVAPILTAFKLKSNNVSKSFTVKGAVEDVFDRCPPNHNAISRVTEGKYDRVVPKIVYEALRHQ